MLACAGLVASLFAGCGKQDSYADDLDTAARTIANASAGVGAPPRPELVESTFQQVRETVTPVRDSSIEEQAAAASLMIAETQLGEAAMQAVELASAMAAYTAGVPAVGDQPAQIGLDDVRHELSRLGRLQTEVELANGFTVANEIAALEDQVAERDRQQATRQDELNTLTERIATTEAELATKDSDAQAERARASELKLEASRSDTDASVQLAEQARLFDRSADAIAFEAELLRADLDTLRPDRERLADQVERLAAERQSLAEAIDRLRAAQREARARGAEAAAAAGELERRIEDMLFGSGGLTTDRLGSLTTLAETVADAYGQAAGTARSGSALRQASNLAQGRAQSAIGSAHNSAAIAIEQAILLLSDVAARGVGGDRVPGAIQSLEAQRVEALQAAAEAFEQAASQLGGASEEAESAYTDLATQARGRADAPAGSFDQAAFDRAQAEAREAREAEFADQAAREFDAAVGDRDAALDAKLDEIVNLVQQGQLVELARMARFDDPQIRDRYIQIATPTEKILQLDRATFEAFGVTLAASRGEAADIELATITVDDLNVQRNGDTVVINIPSDIAGVTDPWTLEYDGSAWQINGESLADADLEAFDADTIGEVLPELTRMGDVASDLIARIRAGEFDSAQEVLLAFGTAADGG